MAPSANELARLYVDERLSARQIAAVYGVAHITVLRWLRRYAIPARPAGSGLAHRGQPPAKREDLRKLIYDQRLTYREVAAIYKVDHSAIPFWLDRLGIPRPSRTRIDYEAVRERYGAGASAAVIASELGCSKTTIFNFLKRMGVERRETGWCAKIAAQDGTLVRSTYEVRVADWLSSRGVAYEYEPPVPFGHGNTRADFLVNSWYIEVWGVHSSPAYKAQKARKIAFYEALGLPLVQLSPHHFSARGQRVLERRLAQCLRPADRGASVAENL